MCARRQRHPPLARSPRSTQSSDRARASDVVSLHPEHPLQFQRAFLGMGGAGKTPQGESLAGLGGGKKVGANEIRGMHNHESRAGGKKPTGPDHAPYSRLYLALCASREVEGVARRLDGMTRQRRSRTNEVGRKAGGKMGMWASEASTRISRQSHMSSSSPLVKCIRLYPPW